VIVHQPDHAVELVESGSADLILAGHTHGGQIVLPGSARWSPTRSSGLPAASILSMASR
jgi:predicted MPP superfamily phosphohydrolase